MENHLESLPSSVKIFAAVLSGLTGTLAMASLPIPMKELHLGNNLFTADPTEGHLFVVGRTSTLSRGKPGAFQTLVVFLFWRRPYRRPPLRAGSGPVPIHGEVQETAVSCHGGPGPSWWRDERTSTHSLWIKERDEMSPHGQAYKQSACAYVSKGTCKLNNQ